MAPKGSKRPRSDSPPGAPRDDRSALIQDIRGFYRTAIARTPRHEVPALVSAAVEGGFCFGPLDPVSNIIANTVGLLPPPECSGAVAEGVAVEENSRIWAKEMARRSLEALVAFLVCYFRYLPTLVALRYLRVAKGDLLAAVRLVETNRCTHGFDIGSRTARLALRCAALAAGHRSPEDLVTATLSLASHARGITGLLSSHPERLTASAIEQLRILLLQEDPECSDYPHLMTLAASRLPPDSACQLSATKDEILARCTESLQRVLLDRIHGFYLDALALLPSNELRHCYHRSLVKAGHLYGPLDPVSNIIVNTIWYAAAFPVPEEQQLELQMVGRWALVRAEHCSLAGLISGLRACAGGNLSDHDAICYLLRNNADFDAAMEALQLCLKDQKGCQQPSFSCTRPSELYRTMANAACHPSPDALQQFLTSDRARMMLPVKSRRLSLKDIQSIIRSLSQEPPSTGTSVDLLPMQPVTEHFTSIHLINKDRFYADHNSFYSKVKTALAKYVLQTGGSELVIHVICGANEHVADRRGPEYSNINWPRSHLKYQLSHFNFLASTTGAPPKLFFAECVNYQDESALGHETICCPVLVPETDAENARCLYCEYRGTSIIHPVDVDYHGRDTDFEKMVQGKHRLTNDRVVDHGALVTDAMDVLEEDFVYFDPRRDQALVQIVNSVAELAASAEIVS